MATSRTGSTRYLALRRRMMQRWRVNATPCHLCGLAIDYTLRTPDPGSAEVDHVIPVSRGGEDLKVENWRPAHRRCNRTKSNTLPDARPALPTTRKW